MNEQMMHGKNVKYIKLMFSMLLYIKVRDKFTCMFWDDSYMTESSHYKFSLDNR